MTTRKSGSKRSAEIDWEARAEQVRKQLEATLSEGGHALESLWHQSAVAALHWVGSHRGRVSAFRKSVKGTPMERVVTAALKAVQAESSTRVRRPRSRTRKPASRRRKAG